MAAPFQVFSSHSPSKEAEEHSAMAAPFQVFPSPSPSEETEEQIFNIASGIALEYAQNFFWSSWHPWDAVNQGNTNETPAFWNVLAPFGTCLGASTHIFHALRDALAKHADADFQKYVQDVKLVTSASAQYAPSEGEVYHAVVALCFDTFAIIIDHSLNSTAFKLPLNGRYLLEPYVPMFSSEQGQDRFRYFQTEVCASACFWGDGSRSLSLPTGHSRC
jgi:hypothetical protein